MNHKLLRNLTGFCLLTGLAACGDQKIGDNDPSATIPPLVRSALTLCGRPRSGDRENRQGTLAIAAGI